MAKKEKKEEKHPGGRPTKYNEEILKKAADYIDLCEDTETKVVSSQGESFTKYETKLTVKLPSIEGLARHLKVHRDTLYEWKNTYKEFSDIFETLLQKQAEVLINKGLSGDYNPTIAKVILTKHGYTDKQEIQHSVQEKQIIKIGDQEIEF